MKFKDIPIPSAKYIATKEVQPFDVPSYGKDSVNLTFEYARGEEERKIYLELSREEVADLIDSLNEFLADDDWNEK